MKRIKCVCGKEAVKRYGLCRGCLKIRDEISNEKASENKDTCTACKFYDKGKKPGVYKCTWNNKEYSTRDMTPCFGFVKKVETANDVRKGL